MIVNFYYVYFKKASYYCQYKNIKAKLLLSRKKFTLKEKLIVTIVASTVGCIIIWISGI
uniref:Transmembrane protein n=1 Tax=Pithovirus LCPAC101 TaxID=2506586 RepID=A0A481Z4V6_9VIRU|nr:MAG: hypothetical protein LCPAC101_03730 [Pithovirus LCPAC101]